MATQSIIYREIKPAEQLAQYIQSYWTFVYTPEHDQVLEHTIIPDGSCSLIFPFHQGRPIGPVLLFGPQEQNFTTSVPPHASTLGIRFMPGAAAAILGTSPEEFLNQTVPAQSLVTGLDVAAIFAGFQEKPPDFTFMDEVCAPWINEKPIQLDEKVYQAAQHILKNDGNIKVSSLPEMVFLSERQLQRRFRKEVGLSIKVFARIRRMRQAIVDVILQDKSYQDVVFDRGFFDRPHLNRDFSAIAGIPPKVLEEYISRIRHIDVD